MIRPLIEDYLQGGISLADLQSRIARTVWDEGLLAVADIDYPTFSTLTDRHTAGGMSEALLKTLLRRILDGKKEGGVGADTEADAGDGEGIGCEVAGEGREDR